MRESSLACVLALVACVSSGGLSLGPLLGSLRCVCSIVRKAEDYGGVWGILGH